MAESAAERAIRLIDLVPYLFNHPGSSLRDIASEFGISVAELIKDLDLLFMCGLPGYTPLELIDLSVEDGIVSLREPQNLDAPRRFSQTEALIIRVALAALEEMLPLSKRERVIRLREKFTRLYTNEVPNDAIYYGSDLSRQHMQIVNEAIASEKKVLITYLNPVKSELTERKISILKVLPETKRTLIEAWCETSNGVRTFNLANMKTVSLTPETSILVDKEKVDRDSFEARIQIDSRTHFYIENQDQLLASGDEYLISVFQSEWLVRNALSESGELVVLAPNWLRSEVVNRSKEALRHYSSAG
jgi:proteasome accessory factor C